VNVTVRIRMHHTTFLLAAAAAAIAIATAPNASAAPGEQPCSEAGGSTNCQRSGNAQVYTSPRPLARVFPPSINPRWRDTGYSARFPEYGFDPKWQSFGYNPLYSGFQPRPSVLRPPQLPTSQTPNATDTGGSTTYQKSGNAQLTAQVGLAALSATQPQYPSSASTPTGKAGSTMYQTQGHAQLTARPGPEAQNASGQAAFFPVSDLPVLAGPTGLPGH
jgi:hypothetical protein